MENSGNVLHHVRARDVTLNVAGLRPCGRFAIREPILDSGLASSNPESTIGGNAGGLYPTWQDSKYSIRDAARMANTLAAFHWLSTTSFIDRYVNDFIKNIAFASQNTISIFGARNSHLHYKLPSRDQQNLRGKKIN